MLAIFYIYDRPPAEQKMEDRAEQVQQVFGGPQASSCADANIVVIKESLGASNHHFLSLFYSVLFYLWFLDVH
jgi:hypothetical protein